MEDFRQKIRNGDVEGIQKLVKKNPTIINKPIDGYGRTPLIVACDVGADRRIIDILIKAGAKLGAKDILSGFTALYWAVFGHRLQAVELLLSRGSNVNEKTMLGNTPLHLAARSSPEWTDGVKAIMNRSAVEVNPRDVNGRTPLHWACYNGSLHTVDLLLGHNGIDANVVENDGDTPLHKAVRGRKYKVVCAMLKQDSVNLEIVNKKYRTPLLEAVSNGHLGIIQRLIARGANVNALAHGGNNCLHLALATKEFNSEVEHMTMLDQFCEELKLGNEERYSGVVVASYLAHHGANFYCKNKIGRTPLDLIENENLKKTLNMLFRPTPCVFCEDEVATETFFPCKHLSLCKKCCPPKIPKRCPTCGQKITSKNSLEGPMSSKPEVQMLAEPPVNRTFEDKETQTMAEPIEAPTHGKFSKVSEPTSSTTKPVECPVLDEKFLQDVAQNLGGKWQQVGRELGIESVQLEIIRYDYPYNTVEQSFQMLRRWFTRCDPEKRTHKTLREALEKVNRTFEDKEIKTLAEPVESVNLDEKLLHSVAKKLGNKWQQLGRELGIKQVDLDIIKSDFPNDTAEQSFRMLYKWFQCCDPANRTLKTLMEALTEIECFDALERLTLDTN